jgi:hypothetical protein
MRNLRGEGGNVGAPTFQVTLEVGSLDTGLESVATKSQREIPHFADSVRDDGLVFVGDSKNVGAPTFKVLLEVQECITKRESREASEDSQNGTASEVIA